MQQQVGCVVKLCGRRVVLCLLGIAGDCWGLLGIVGDCWGLLGCFVFVWGCWGVLVGCLRCQCAGPSCCGKFVGFAAYFRAMLRQLLLQQQQQQQVRPTDLYTYEHEPTPKTYMGLRACYAMPGTEAAEGATVCLVLSERMVVLAAAA
eukprot:2742816-Rhodomonas_salina.1